MKRGRILILTLMLSVLTLFAGAGTAFAQFITYQVADPANNSNVYFQGNIAVTSTGNFTFGTSSLSNMLSFVTYDNSGSVPTNVQLVTGTPVTTVGLLDPTIQPATQINPFPIAANTAGTLCEGSGSNAGKFFACSLSFGYTNQFGQSFILLGSGNAPTTAGYNLYAATVNQNGFYEFFTGDPTTSVLFGGNQKLLCKTSGEQGFCPVEVPEIDGATLPKAALLLGSLLLLMRRRRGAAA